MPHEGHPLVSGFSSPGYWFVLGFAGQLGGLCVYARNLVLHRRGGVSD